MTRFLGKLIDLYTILTCHFADAMAKVDRVVEDEGLKQSLLRKAIADYEEKKFVAKADNLTFGGLLDVWGIVS